MGGLSMLNYLVIENKVNKKISKLLPHMEFFLGGIASKVVEIHGRKQNTSGEILVKTSPGNRKFIGTWELLPAKKIENSFMGQIKNEITHHDVKPKIVYADGEKDACLKAVSILLHENIITPMLLGDPKKIKQKAAELHIDLKETKIINTETSLSEDYVNTYYNLRKHKGIDMKSAKDTMKKGNYYGAMMVEKNDADGMVSGLSSETKPFIPAFEIIKNEEGINRSSSVFFMLKDNKPLLFADCSVNKNPDAKTLAEIGAITGDTAKTFGLDPKIAFLSFSTFGTSKGPEVDKVAEATKLAKSMRPQYKIDGEIQFDAALLQEVASKKCPNSEVAGKANSFIFPDLNSGNIAYKIAERLGGYKAIGPVVQGIRKPVNDVSRGAEPEDIADLGYITALQAIKKSGKGMDR